MHQALAVRWIDVSVSCVCLFLYTYLVILPRWADAQRWRDRLFCLVLIGGGRMSETQSIRATDWRAYLAVAASFVAALVVVLVLTPQYFSAVVLALPLVVAGLTLGPTEVGLVAAATFVLAIYGASVASLPAEVILVRLLSFLAIAYLCVQTAKERQATAQRAEEVEAARRQADYERARWQATVESMLEPLTVCDARGQVTYVNPAYQRRIGYLVPPDLPLEEHPRYYQLYRPDGSLFPPEELPLQKAALTGQEVRDVEIVQRTADGQEFIGIFSAAPLRDSHGQIVGAVAVGHDITERKQAEAERERLLQQLRESNERLTTAAQEANRQRENAERRAEELDAAISAIGDGLLIYGPHMEIERMNPAAEDILGPIAEQWRALPPPERAQTLHVETPSGEPISPTDTPGARALRGQAVTNCRMVIHRPDGRTIHLISNAAPIRGPQGQILGAVANFSDITELVELQRAQQDIASVVAHDIRQPLTIIQGQSQLLLRWLEAGRLASARQSAEAILTSTRRMNVMIQDLVDSVRGELGKLELDRKPLDLGQFLAELLQRSATSYEISRVHLTIAGQVPMVCADPDRLERVVLNLISNALKYSPAETVVEIRLRQEGESAVVEVQDQGPGIPPESLPRLFQRFYRAPGAARREGMGLGLYIARVLVEAHGGHVWVESHPGQGSTFSFSLPTAERCQRNLAQVPE